jgi:hypothetical protein
VVLLLEAAFVFSGPLHVCTCLVLSIAAFRLHISWPAGFLYSLLFVCSSLMFEICVSRSVGVRGGGCIVQSAPRSET